MKHINMVGQPCPIPVVTARRALQSGEAAVSVAVAVDNQVAVQNLKKMADGEGYRFSFEETGEGRYSCVLSAGDEPEVKINESRPAENVQGATVLIGREYLGDGADELGAILMKGFIFSLTELDAPPAHIIFLNGGAKLTTNGARTVDDLRTLDERGTRVWTCGTCANYYGITDQLAVGQLTDMMAIVRMLDGAERLIAL